MCCFSLWFLEAPNNNKTKQNKNAYVTLHNVFFGKPLDSTRVIIVQLRFMYVLKKFYYKYVLLFLKNDNVSTIASCVEE